MHTGIYKNKKNGKLVHAKPAATQIGIVLYYNDKNGAPAGRVQAATVKEFSDRFEEPAAERNKKGAASH